jgi:Cu/Ag efflux pump CusA
VRQLGDVVIAPKVKRGEGSANARPAVVMGVLKQPDANTLEVTARVDALLDEMEPSLPEGLTLNRRVFRQADFIESAVANVGRSLRDGALLVAVILLLFLGNLRASVISLAAIPVSLVVAVLALDAMGLTLDTMTLGGLTIAIGSVVDDAIIDVENVFRRLRENHALPPGGPAGSAGGDLRGVGRDPRIDRVRHPDHHARVFAAVLPGRHRGADARAARHELRRGAARVPGRRGHAHAGLVRVFAAPGEGRSLHGESRMSRWSQRVYGPLLDRAGAPGLGAGALRGGSSIASLAVVPFLGRTFLPEFNEGALTINVVTKPGTSLEASDRLGRRVETRPAQLPRGGVDQPSHRARGAR